MRKFILAVLLLVTIGVSAQQDTLKYRINLRDKAATVHSLDRPEEFLSGKAIERRRKQHLAIDSTDLPVCRQYVDIIRDKGVNIVALGKWDNFVTVSCNDTMLINEIAKLPFVRTAKKVWAAPDSTKTSTATKRDTLVNEPVIHSDSFYGSAICQIQINKGDKLHEAGFRGQGMTIAVIDAGFHNADSIKSMQNIHVLGTKDFVTPRSDIYVEDNHGMNVLSCMGMNQPYSMIGTAPEASYWLLRSEDAYSESLVEEDYWATAIEFADSVGVDLVNTSLGYYAFDDSSGNYHYCDLDGHSALISRQAAKAADKGIVVVCSAGNTGAGPWKKIISPADADNVLTVGAVDKNGKLASFSSVGNTADGRVKPDVVAVGVESDMMDTDGLLKKANGTSFSSPILCGMVACLWQALPQLTAKEIIELVRRSGDRADSPDNIYGYGIPDMWKAYQSSK